LTVVPFKSIEIYPAGTNGKLDVAKVADTAVVAEIFALANVKLPTEVVVAPSVNVVFPNVNVLFANAA
jgi:hypothetical protein